jgi:hypothetical protein
MFHRHGRQEFERLAICDSALEEPLPLYCLYIGEDIEVQEIFFGFRALEVCPRVPEFAAS